MAGRTQREELLLQIDANVELLRKNLTQAELDVADYERKASKSADNVGKSMEGMAKKGGGAVAALTATMAGLGVMGVIGVGRQFLKFADDMATAADVANVSVERYQRLRGAFRELRVSAADADGVLNRLSITLGDVQSGTAAKGVTAALDAMGVTSRILNGEITTTDGLLDAIAGSANRFATEAQFTSRVVDVLGRKLGVEFAAAVRDGGQALHEAEGRVTAATEHQIQAMADANRAIERFTADTQQKFLLWAGTVVGAVQDATTAIQSMSRLEAAGRFFVSPVLATRAAIGAGAQMRVAADHFEAGGSIAADLAAMQALPQGSDARAALMAKFQKSWMPFGGEAEAWGDEITVTAPRRDPKPARAGRAAPPELSPAELRLQNVAGPGVLEGVDRTLADVRELQGALLEVQDFTADIEASALAASLEGARDFTRDMADNLAQAIVYGQDIGTALVNSFKAAAAEALANGLFKLLLGEGESGGLFGALIGGIGRALGGKRALGGPVSAGRAYLVGERGTEVFVPSVSGRVLAGGAGASAQPVTFDMRGAVVTEDLLMQMEAMAAQGAATAIGVSRRDMARSQMRRLPRAMGA